MKRTRLKEVVNSFSVDFNSIDTNDVLNIHKYLMTKTRCKIMFGLIKKIFTGLLTGLVNGSNHAKSLSLINPKCMTQPILIKLHPKDCSQEFHYHPCAFKLDRLVGSCNTHNDSSNKICVPNKTKDFNRSLFNMITGINGSKALIKHISYECICRLDGRKCNSDQWQNNDKWRCECKKCHVCEKYYEWNPTASNCENGKYLANIMDNSVIICDEVTELYMKKKKLYQEKPIKR